MMIAYWNMSSVESQVINTRLFTSSRCPLHDVIKLAGEIRRDLPRSATGRSRTA